MRKTKDSLLRGAILLCTGLIVALLVLIIGYILIKGVPKLSWSFLSGVPSVLNGTTGILPFLLNTVYVILLALAVVLPLGVGAAIYLTEYASNRRLISMIEFTTEILSGIPSILYGLVGIQLFRRVLGLSLASGALTLVIMTLPTMIRTTQESLKSVPQSCREGAMGLGATKWHIIRTLVLPCSLDGIVTGCILAVGRIVGESAALIFTAGGADTLLSNFFSAYSQSGATLSVALYLYGFERGDFESAYGIAAVLMVLVLLLNFAAKAAKKLLKHT